MTTQDILKHGSIDATARELRIECGYTSVKKEVL